MATNSLPEEVGKRARERMQASGLVRQPDPAESPPESPKVDRRKKEPHWQARYDRDKRPIPPERGAQIRAQLIAEGLLREAGLDGLFRPYRVSTLGRSRGFGQKEG
jgi:hypothetical protein